MKRHVITLLKIIGCGAAVALSPEVLAGEFSGTLPKERRLTLEEAICMARTQSVDAAVALNELKTAYLGIPHLPRRTVAGNELYGYGAGILQEIQLLSAGRRFLYLCTQQLHRDEWIGLHRPEHLADRR